MLTAQQHQQRKQGLGGSDIGALLGLSPYKTPYELYLEKTATEPFINSTTEAMEWGNLLEAPIATIYEQKTGQKTEVCGRFVHPQHPLFFAHPDRLIVGQDKGLEIKNVGINMASLWGPSGSNIIPEHYFMQVAHYMYVTGLKEWDVAAFIGGNSLRLYTFYHNEAFDAIIEEEGLKFWRNHVEPNIPPEVSFSGNAKDFLRQYYATLEEKTITLSEEYLAWKQKYVESQKMAKEYAKAAEIASSHILSAMEDAQCAVLPDGSSFHRKKISTKGYAVQPKEYIRLDFKDVKKVNSLAEGEE